MKKIFKKLFISTFITVFSSIYFLSTLQTSATTPNAIYLEEKIFCYCLTSLEDLISNPSHDGYISLCKNLCRLIDSQEDYQEMNEILNGVAFHLFGRNLSQDLYIEDYDEEFINLYKNAIKGCVSGNFTFEEENLNLFDAIFVYSYILHLDESNPDKGYLDSIEQILIKNGINPLNFSM